MINSIILSCIDFIKLVLLVNVIFMQIFRCFCICQDQPFNQIIAGDNGLTNLFDLIYENCTFIKSPDTHSGIVITF